MTVTFELGDRKHWPKSATIAVLFFGGLASLCYGAFLIYRPAGFIAAGLLSTLLGLFLSKASTHNS